MNSLTSPYFKMSGKRIHIKPVLENIQVRFEQEKITNYKFFHRFFLGWILGTNQLGAGRDIL